MFNILKKMYELHNDLPVLPERKKIEKVGRLLANLNDKYWICYSYKIFKETIKSWIIF